MSEATIVKWNLAKTGATSALVVLAWLGTTLVRIPIPATTGYFNLGDIFVILAGLWLGPIGGLLVGLIGPTTADAIGYPQFILATAVTKGLEGFLVGAIAGDMRSKLWRKWLGAFVGAFTIVCGYFVFEAFVYPALGSVIPFFKVTTFADAVIELIPNAIQGIVGAIVAMGLWKALSGISLSPKHEAGST